MKTSEQLDLLADALAKAIAAFPPIAKDKTVKTKQYSYSYADLASILEAVRPVLSAHGLALVQTVGGDRDGAKVTTRLLHSSGQWIEDEVIGSPGSTAQEFGSSLSYLRRYSVVAILCLMPDDDDDGASAAPHPPRRQEHTERQAPRTSDVNPDAFRRLWMAKINKLAPGITDDTRHAVQEALFGCASLRDIPFQKMAALHSRLSTGDEEVLAQRIGEEIDRYRESIR